MNLANLQFRCVNSLEPVPTADAVSLTASASGFTPLAAVACCYAYDSHLLTQASEVCNRKCEVCILKELAPTVFLVPRTRGQKRSAFLIADLLNAVEAERKTTLHFTHFHHLSTFPTDEIQLILDHLKSRHFEHLQTIIFKVDKRFEAEFETLNSKSEQQPEK